MPAMRILYLAPAARRPGRLTEFTFLDEEIRGLCEAGVEAHLLSTSAEYDHVAHGVHVHSLPPEEGWRRRAAAVGFLTANRRLLNAAMLRSIRWALYYARYERWAARVIRENRIDLVHSMFGWPGGFGGALASHDASVPLIANLRGMDLLVDETIGYGMRLDPGTDPAIRMLLRRADRTLYASSFMRDRGIELGADPARAVWIPKGVDTDHFSPAVAREDLRRELGFDRAVVLCVCGLIRRKGIDVVIEALVRTRAAPPHMLVVCGDGPERESLEQLARDRGVADRVRFLGYVERSTIPVYLAACDVFVLASRKEAAGNVVLEAMASGRPVICTDSGGPPEYVRRGETGYVVPVGDPHELACRISELLADPVLADRMGARGRQAALQEHSYDRMIEDVRRLYAETLREARDGSAAERRLRTSPLL